MPFNKVTCIGIVALVVTGKPTGPKHAQVPPG
jgi:hypothetical protein